MFLNCSSNTDDRDGVEQTTPAVSPSVEIEKEGRNKETQELVCQCRRLPRGVRGERGRTLDGGMIGTK